MLNYMKYTNPLEEYLKEIHAKQYIGTDDDMSDNFNNWFENLSNEDVTNYANELIQIVASEMKEGFEMDKTN